MGESELVNVTAAGTIITFNHHVLRVKTVVENKD
jgi:hypothetical protein